MAISGEKASCMVEHVTERGSVIPTRYFLGRPKMGEEMHVSIEKGKTLIIRLMAIGPVVEGSPQRDVWFEVNGEIRAVSVDDKNSAVETLSREKASSDPGSIGAPMSGVVIEVRVKEGQQVKKGDPLCGEYMLVPRERHVFNVHETSSSPERDEGEYEDFVHSCPSADFDAGRWNHWSPRLCQEASSGCSSTRVKSGLFIKRNFGN
jgi:hypothetical protein